MKKNVTMWPMERGFANNPDYVTATKFRDFVAYGLAECWLSGNPQEVNDNCNFTRPVETDDVVDLRTNFLDLLECAVGGIWSGDFTPGHGNIDSGGDDSVIIAKEGGDDDGDGIIDWCARVDDDCVMMEMIAGKSGGRPIFFALAAIEDRPEVVRVFELARRFANGKVWDKLTEMCK